MRAGGLAGARLALRGGAKGLCLLVAEAVRRRVEQAALGVAVEHILGEEDVDAAALRGGRLLRAVLRVGDKDGVCLWRKWRGGSVRLEAAVVFIAAGGAGAAAAPQRRRYIYRKGCAVARKAALRCLAGPGLGKEAIAQAGSEGQGNKCEGGTALGSLDGSSGGSGHWGAEG